MDERRVDERYDRQARVPRIGVEGQKRLGRARVAIVGIGALGSRSAEDLARAGVGYLRLIDRDFVELSNLHRQHLFDERDAAAQEPKVLAAARRLGEINAGVEIDPRLADLGPSEVDDLLTGVDLIVDGSDNFRARYVVNDFAVREALPWVYGACVGAQAMVAAFVAGRGCLRCLFPEPPPTGSTETCESAGVLGPAAALVSAWQCALALRLLASPADPPGPRLLSVDVLDGQSREVALPEKPVAGCESCDRRAFPALCPGESSRATLLCGRNAVQLSSLPGPFPTLEALALRLPEGVERELTAHLLRIRAPEAKITVFRGGRAIVQGTDDPGRARALFDRYVGS